MEITVVEKECSRRFGVDELAGMAGDTFAIASRVPDAEGVAFDFHAWFDAWRFAAGEAEAAIPTHLKVEAADEFAATVPWSELAQAAFVFEQDGGSLKKGFPLRLYVPDGSSKCLNVKSIVRIALLHEPQLSGHATYGFANTLKPEDLKKKG